MEKKIEKSEKSEKSDKQKALENALAIIDKSHGKGSMLRLGDKPAEKLSVIPTGVLSLDIALGVGGIPRGRIVEIYGNEASGKTTLTLHLIAQAQKRGGIAAFIDAEHALDPNYAEAIGVDIENLYVSQPDTGEAALDIAETLVRSGSIDIIVVDSVAALTPRAEIEGDMGDSHMGLQARLMSQALRKLTGIVSQSKTCLVFINQLRQKIGQIYGGNPETTTGGNALKYYASVRIEVRRSAAIKEKEETIGNLITIKVVKNKVAPPFKTVHVDIIYGKGILREGILFNMGLAKDIIQKSGSWYSMGSTKLAQGENNVRSFLLENPEVANSIETKLREIYEMPADT